MIDRGENQERMGNGLQKDIGRTGSQKDSRRITNEWQKDVKRSLEGKIFRWIAIILPSFFFDPILPLSFSHRLINERQ